MSNIYKKEIEKIAKSKNEKFGNDYQILNDNGIENKDNRTRIVKDRLVPLMKNEVAGETAGALGAGVGAGLGYGSYKLSSSARKKLYNSDFAELFSKNPGDLGELFGSKLNKRIKSKKIINYMKTPMKILFGKEFKKYRALASAATGAAMLAPKFKEAGKVMDRAKRFEKKHMQAFGTQPTESEYLQAANLNPNKKSHALAYKMFNTPESLIKSKKRDVSLAGKINEDIGTPIYFSPRNIYKSDDSFNHNSTQQATPSVKTANIYIDAIEKVANIGSTIKTAKKVVPATTGAIAGITGGALTGNLSSRMIDDDDKHKKLKVALSTGAGALTGGALGGLMGKDTIGIVDGVYGKITNPQKLKQEAKRFGKEVYNTYIPKPVADNLSKKIKDIKIKKGGSLWNIKN